MVIDYTKRRLSIKLVHVLYEQLKETTLKMNWTEQETLGWAVASGIDEIDKIEEMETELSELISIREGLNLELEKIAIEYGKLSSRNAALRYEYFEVFSDNKTMSIKLTGAKVLNRSFKNALKIRVDYNEQQERTDRNMVEKYVLSNKGRA
jgi:hypothetical protein